MEAFKNIKKNLITSTLLILCFIVLFCLFGEVTAQSFLSGKANESSEIESLIEYSQIQMAPFTSASYRVQSEALFSLSDEEIYQFGRAMDNIKNGLLEDYGSFGYKIETDYGLNNNTEVRAEYCSYDLYEVNSYTLIIKEGSWFSKEDYIYENQIQEGWIAPVVIGSTFAEKHGLSVGDIFVPDMFYDEERLANLDPTEGEWGQWRVIGILEKDSSWLYRFGALEPANSRVLLPDHELPTLDECIKKNGGQINEDVLVFIRGDLFNYFRNTNFYIKKDDMEEAIAFVNEQIASSSFLTQYYIARESSDTLTMVAQNQEKASNFYNTISIITYILSSFGIIMSVSNKIQNNKRNYAIHSLNGATVYDLIMCSVTEIMLLMLIADVFFFAFPYRIYYHRLNMGNNIYVARATPGFVLSVNIITLLVAVIVSAIVLHKFDTVAHLKKKE